MSTQPAPTIRKFNPGTFQSDPEVIRQFVARERELAIVLETLRGNVDSPSCQHSLIVAPRGRGKTMLLARVAAELRTNDALSARLLPVRFMEESQEIMNAGDFWLEALFHLAAETAKTDPAFAQNLRAARDDLAGRWQGDELELRARATVLDAADRLGRRLVLMVENLQDLCDDLDDDFGWKLREALQTEPQIIFLATATSRFKGLDDPAQPFFEQFRAIFLDPLDTGECRRLWELVSGDDVKDREIRPLQILTGGSPRLLVIVAQFSRHRSLRQLMEELVTLIDDHTEYFRSHLQGLARVERLIYLAVIDLWQPSSTAEIAARCRQDVRTVSAMLGRLVSRGAISAGGPNRRRHYAATERLYCIYYKLRRERDQAAVVQNLIRFMAAFYNESELSTIAKLNIEATQEPSIREGIERVSVDRPDKALCVCDAFERLPQDVSEASEIDLRWKVALIRTRALNRQGDHHAAMTSFRTVYTGFAPADELKMRQMQEVVIELAAADTQRRDLLDVLLTDDEKSAALAPFVIALGMTLGESVRASAEVMEVARDIIKEIKQPTR